MKMGAGVALIVNRPRKTAVMRAGPRAPICTLLSSYYIHNHSSSGTAGVCAWDGPSTAGERGRSGRAPGGGTDAVDGEHAAGTERERAGRPAEPAADRHQPAAEGAGVAHLSDDGGDSAASARDPEDDEAH